MIPRLFGGCDDAAVTGIFLRWFRAGRGDGGSCVRGDYDDGSSSGGREANRYRRTDRVTRTESDGGSGSSAMSFGCGDDAAGTTAQWLIPPLVPRRTRTEFVKLERREEPGYSFSGN